MSIKQMIAQVAAFTRRRACTAKLPRSGERGYQQRIARNVAWNWAGTAAHMAAGFVVARYLFGQLGESKYGLWILIAAMTGYLNLLDFGLRGALGRHIAFFKAKKNQTGVNSVVSTGFGLLAVGSIGVFAAIFPARILFFKLFDVPSDAVYHANVALLLIGVNLALVFFFYVFESILWANQRFDLINWVDIPSVGLRTALIFALVGADSRSLVTLGAIHVVVTIANGLALGTCVLAVDPKLRIRLSLIRFATIRKLFDFGIWCFLTSAARIASSYLGTTLIGFFLGVRLVSPYSFASRLVGYVEMILITGTGVITPEATTLHAAKKHEQQKRLFLEGGRACMTLSLYFFGGFIFLGSSFLRLWIGNELEYAAVLLAILICGELLPLSQWITYSIVIGKNRHRLWAGMCLLEFSLVVGLALLFIWLHPSVLSIALAIAIPAAICRGIVQMIYGCILMQISLWHYVGRALLFPTLATLPAGLVLAALTMWREPQSWLELIAFGGAYTIVFGLLASVFVFGLARLGRVVALIASRKPALEETVDIEAASGEYNQSVAGYAFGKGNLPVSASQSADRGTDEAQ